MAEIVGHQPVLDLSNPSFEARPDLRRQIHEVTAAHVRTFGPAQTEWVVSGAPGRAEIVGCHTDYNKKRAMSAGTPELTLCAARENGLDTLRVISTDSDFPGLCEFSLADLRKGYIERDETKRWGNFTPAVAAQLIDAGLELKGLDLAIASNVPHAGGVSSSAALELSQAYSLSVGSRAVARHQLDGVPFCLEIAQRCQLAENSPWVNSPCGFLDQAGSALGGIAAMNFSKMGDWKNFSYEVPFNIPREDATFMVITDPSVKRELGLSGYPARRAVCECSVPILGGLTGRPIENLGDISIGDFLNTKERLELIGGKICAEIVSAHLKGKEPPVIAKVYGLNEHRIFTGETAAEYLIKSGVAMLETIKAEKGDKQPASAQDLPALQEELASRMGDLLRRRVEHVIFDDHRVELFENAARAGDAVEAGKILTDSGQSGIELYDLAENTPELATMVSAARSVPGVYGIRNMGGGFSLTSLALVETGMVDEIKRALTEIYSTNGFPGQLTFYPFVPAPGASVLTLN